MRSIIWFLVVFLLVLIAGVPMLAQHRITTVAGGGPNDIPALSSNIDRPSDVGLDGAGNFYIADPFSSRIFKVDPAGNLIIVAGNGVGGYSGDGGPATSAELLGPEGIFADSVGNLFISDSVNNRIREVVAATGLIQTVAGNGTPGYSGDGGPATSAELSQPFAVSVGGHGNIFISDTLNNRIREVVAATGLIQTVAGNGTLGYSGDGGPATSAELLSPEGIFADGVGNLFIADSVNNRIREVVATTGVINTIAGNGVSGYSGDGGPATRAQINTPGGIFVNGAGNLFIADSLNSRIREVVAATGIIQTVAGNGEYGASGDGDPATNAGLGYPNYVFVDNAENLFISDPNNNRVREVVAATGVIKTIAGNGRPGYSGDGGPATSAQISFPQGIFVDGSGNLFIADSGNNRIREVVAATGIIQTVAGNGTQAYSGPSVPATSTGIEFPLDVSVDRSGNIFLATFARCSFPTCGGVPVYSQILEVVAATGLIQTVAGNGTPGYSGDSGPGTTAQINVPQGIFVDGSGNLFIADSGNNRIREVVAATGIIQTVAGNGTPGYSGDGGPATNAGLGYPYYVFVDSAENLFISDSNNNRVREVVAATGIIQTVAGNGAYGYSGDGGPAATAELAFPAGLAGSPSGDLLIADSRSGRIRSVSQLITTGTGTDFSLAAAAGGNCPAGGNCSTSATISAGQTATYNLQVSQLGGFSGAVALTCSGAPGASICSVSPSSVPPNGSSNYAFTVTVSNTLNVLVVPWPEAPLTPIPPASPIALPLLLTLLLILLSWVEVAESRAVMARLLASAVLLISVMMSSGCSSGGHQPPTNATLTITGTSGGVTHQLNLSLTVNR